MQKARACREKLPLKLFPAKPSSQGTKASSSSGGGASQTRGASGNRSQTQLYRPRNLPPNPPRNRRMDVLQGGHHPQAQALFISVKLQAALFSRVSPDCPRTVERLRCRLLHLSPAPRLLQLRWTRHSLATLRDPKELTFRRGVASSPEVCVLLQLKALPLTRTRSGAAPACLFLVPLTWLPLTP